VFVAFGLLAVRIGQPGEATVIAQFTFAPMCLMGLGLLFQHDARSPGQGKDRRTAYRVRLGRPGLQGRPQPPNTRAA